mmetsp:Transcript_5028/g.7683  ORF Transcript_5028/g.7683 Transcript_5028/m.7683 type:complete len:292 (+) Transcript_5028:70-945(+)|eukprot:CAMPEP_0185019446 /NCGR_PEP_ID=MMETSP1103-20130426/2061_1 /TAXON_ID=36769 /ORGANISM="Paraphysomonas bandaiensis, Strain Caron Lab Isolate" /LENGTH=291 /DNA_ID=CAMNT_0027549769 /DNA_START=16 /DNA_END=891 /DNA_ORIENTATION=+
MGQCCSCCKSKKGKFAAYKKDNTTPLLKKLKDELPPSTRVVVIKLEHARDLASAETFSGMSNPYFEMMLKPADKYAGEQQQRSTAKHRTLNPRWEPAERFQFVVSDMETSRIVISCYHRFNDTETKVLGDAVLSTKDVGDQPSITTLKLINPDNGKFHGDVELEVVHMDVNHASSVEEHRVYEYQRWQPVVHWGSDYPGHLLPTDPGRWSTADGKKFGETFSEVEPPLPAGWEVIAPWATTLTTGDLGGWQYSVDFKSVSWHEEQGFGMYVRRRLWTREVANHSLDSKIPN